ncbi:MAG: hypothetical protein A3F17_00460 [Gammaproteobacteria bacterium RIFCSPHIGHO2_12_FULL_41_15]|nr:MAG: hypothetical protein A3F17_00460 [Gammaproteobacteria bacterium RIFCSPHIGHO2_12_FULL_41_15]
MHRNIQHIRKNPAITLLVTQLFSCISYAVLYSTLVLYMTQKLEFSSSSANSIMGLFVAFNFGLHLLGGYIGGRLLSYRALYLLGMLLQIFACLFIALQTVESLRLGLALFLTGAGLNVPCINMMLTQQFKPHDPQRETAFLWNYAGMNIGYFLGFSIAGYFQLNLNFYTLFIAAAITAFISSLMIIAGWHTVKDTSTPLEKLKVLHHSKKTLRFIGACSVVAGVFVGVFFLLQYAKTTRIFMISIGIFMFLFFIYLGLRQKEVINRNRIFAYVILSLGGMVFWSLYQLAPMGLVLFALNNVDRHIFGITITPQWIQNINTTVIVIGGFLMPPLFKKIRQYIAFGFPLQFALSLLLIAIGFFSLVIGIHYAAPDGLSSFSWITISYVFQSVGELLIGPIGYGMIGLLATENLQGLMMGSWMLIVGGSSGVVASYLSNYAIQSTTSNNPLLTNPGYAHLFLMIAIAATVAAIVLFSLIPHLERLIQARWK